MPQDTNHDLEVTAMQKGARLLDSLGDAARHRVLAYLVARFVDEASATPLRAKALDLTSGAR